MRLLLGCLVHETHALTFKCANAEEWISEAFWWQHGMKDSASNCTGILGDIPLGYNLGLPLECLANLNASYNVLAEFMEQLKNSRRDNGGFPEERIRAYIPLHSRQCRLNQGAPLPAREQLETDQDSCLAALSIAAEHQPRKRRMLPMSPPPPPKRQKAFEAATECVAQPPLPLHGHQLQITGQHVPAKNEAPPPPGWPRWAVWFPAFVKYHNVLHFDIT